MDLETKTTEEVKTDVTLPSDSENGNPNTDTEPKVEEVPELNSSAEPTEEQVKEAEPEAMRGVDGSDTTVTESSEESVEGTGMTDEQAAVEKMLSQSQVNELIGQTRVETRDKTLKGLYDRYGVNDETGMDELVGKSQTYDTLKEETDSVIKGMKDELGELKGRVAMYESDINPERYEDVKLILKGKGKEVTAENILSEIETHPEWKKAPLPSPILGGDQVAGGNFVKEEEQVPAQPEKPVMVLGNDRPETQSGQTEREAAMKLYDLL